MCHACCQCVVCALRMCCMCVACMLHGHCVCVACMLHACCMRVACTLQWKRVCCMYVSRASHVCCMRVACILDEQPATFMQDASTYNAHAAYTTTTHTLYMRKHFSHYRQHLSYQRQCFSHYQDSGEPFLPLLSALFDYRPWAKMLPVITEIAH